jgi:hypothetical protein
MWMLAGLLALAGVVVSSPDAQAIGRKGKHCGGGYSSGCGSCGGGYSGGHVRGYAANPGCSTCGGYAYAGGPMGVAVGGVPSLMPMPLAANPPAGTVVPASGTASDGTVMPAGGVVNGGYVTPASTTSYYTPVSGTELGNGYGMNATTYSSGNTRGRLGGRLFRRN